jgi:hypothetical protein
VAGGVRVRHERAGRDRDNNRRVHRAGVRRRVRKRLEICRRQGRSSLTRERHARAPMTREIRNRVEQEVRGRVPGPARLLILDLPRGAVCRARR